MASIAQDVTAQQLWEMPDQRRFELINGELIPMSPPGFDHGCIAYDVAAAIGDFVRSRKLGLVSVEAGFYLSRDPDTVRSPDVAFVRAERVPPEGVRSFFPGPPDLAVEIISPADRASEVISKAQDWLRAGCVAVWVFDPETKTVTTYGQRQETRFLGGDDVLDCDELLPGFRFRVSAAFSRR